LPRILPGPAAIVKKRGVINFCAGRDAARMAALQDTDFDRT